MVDKFGGELADDCLTLLTYVNKHPDERQSYRSLSEATGIPRTNLEQLLGEARRNRHGSLLTRVACKYRFDFEIFSPKRRGRLIGVVYVGY